MIDNNYFFVDGSSLLADVKRAKRELSIADDFLLDLTGFSQYFTGHFGEYGSGSYRRFVFYFGRGDKRVQEALCLPNPFGRDSGDKRVEYCGKVIAQHKKAREWLDAREAPQSVLECLYRSEKAVDTQICCDALVLAGIGKLERLFLYANDYDYVPLCKSLRVLGCNINLLRLQEKPLNRELLAECDALQIFHADQLRNCFIPPSSPAPRS